MIRKIQNLLKTSRRYTFSGFIIKKHLNLLSTNKILKQVQDDFTEYISIKRYVMLNLFQHLAGNNSCYRLKSGFTLAEILITLTIVGIIASMIIPALQADSEKKELKEGLKVAYSILSQGLQRMAIDDGSHILDRYNGNARTFKPVFMKYFNVAKDCGWSSCVPLANPSSIYMIYSKLSGCYTDLFNDGQFILNNGMTVFIQNYTPSVGLLISADVNGYKKGPNIWGYDVFTFEIMPDDTLRPAGAPGTGEFGHFGTGLYNNQATYCSPGATSTYNGIGCTYKALTDETYWDNLP